MDSAGYFVIYPIAEQWVIDVEHYPYDNRLLNSLESTSPRALYLRLIEEGWVIEISHAAYLGKEMLNAEISLKAGAVFVQDAA